MSEIGTACLHACLMLKAKYASRNDIKILQRVIVPRATILFHQDKNHGKSMIPLVIKLSMKIYTYRCNVGQTIGNKHKT